MIALSDSPLDIAALLAAVGDDEHGGTALFVGTTRREADSAAVDALVYEAYEELALAEMAAVAAEAEAAWGARVAVAHRVGAVAVGEPSVIVAASAGHRPAAFAACRQVIDELKARVPVWKQSVHPGGDARWIDGRDAPRAAPTPDPAGRPHAG
ncbi:MAG: molybdenum cofactor biosynthesis protein MoaE [Thermoleophilia bacterium]